MAMLLSSDSSNTTGLSARKLTNPNHTLKANVMTTNPALPLRQFGFPLLRFRDFQQTSAITRDAGVEIHSW